MKSGDRDLTVVFTDVEGSTDLSASAGDEVAQDALRAHEEAVRDSVARHRGREVKTLGDGFLLAFESARDAVACGLEIQRRHGAQGGVRVRIGAHTGAVTERDGDVFGATVNAAARITAHARGGQILVSPGVLEEAGELGDVTAFDVGLFWLKGFPERWRLFEIRSPQTASQQVSQVAGATTLIGREEERADLRRRVDEAAAGRGSLVLIGGEPGVGKTRLTEEVAIEARSRGMLAFAGQCSEAEGAPPYLPIVEIVESALRLVPEPVFRETLGESGGEMARLVPEIGRRFSDVPPPLELPPEQSRRYLWNSVREFVDRIGRRRPLLLVLDDLHWADESTLLLLEFLAPHLEGTPVLILGTYRDVELDVARPFARTLEGLVRRRLAHRISLSRLARPQVGEMLRAMSGQEPPERLADAIYGETEGNPFFVEEVFQHLAEEGRIFDESGRWRHEVEIGEVDVPESVRLVLGRRLARLGEGSRGILTSGAILGRSFPLEALEPVAQKDEDEILDALDEAERAKLITTQSIPGTTSFAFAHELIRQTLLAQLSTIRRQRLHLRAADALERIYASKLDEHAPEIANHLMESGPGADPDRMRRYCRLAGDRALEAAAFGEAVRHLENALSMEPDDERERADLLANLGLALRSVGRWEEAVEIWGQALAAYEALGDAEHVGALAADVALNTAWAARWEESFAITARGLSALAGRDTVDRIRLLGLGAVMVSSAGNHDGAHQMLVDGHRVARELDIEPSETYLSAAEVIHHYSFMRMRDVIAAGEVAMATLRASGATWELVSVQHWVAFALAFTNRWDDARSLLDEMDPVADRLGHLGAQLFSHRIRGLMALLESGDMTILERTSKRDIELCRKAGFPWDSHSYVWLGLVEGGRGNAERSNELFEEALKREPAGAYAGVAEGFDMLTRAYLGDREGSLARWSSRREEYLTQNVKTFGGWMFVLCGIEALIVLGHAEEAAELHPLVLEAIATGTELRGWDGASLERLAGMTAAATESWDEADSHFARAMEFARRYPNVAEAALVKLWYGRCLLDRGRSDDRERAGAMLSEAEQRFAALRMPLHERRARELLEGVDSAALSSGGSSSG